MKTIKLIQGLIGFLIVWLVLLALSPFMITILCAIYAKEFLTGKSKQVDKPQILTYIPATTDNNTFSAN